MYHEFEEIWRTIEEFPNYEISTFGRIYNNRQDCYMQTSKTLFGHVKITLMDENHVRHTRSVARILAEAFILPSNARCTQVVVLDGNLGNIWLENLVWRPPWYAWKYSRQLKVEQPTYFKNLFVNNITKEIFYHSIIEAGMAEGLLFSDIWRSTYTGERVFPDDSIFEIVDMRKNEGDF